MKIFKIGLVFCVFAAAFCTSIFAQTGVTDTEILVGMSTALEGPASFLGTSYKTGAMAVINDVNANGGIHGRKIRLVAYDDGYNPGKCVANANKLIKKDKVFCMLGNVGTPTTMAIKSLITREKMLLFAPFTGAEPLRKPVNPYIINYRASYNQEVEAFIAGVVDKLGIKNVAVFYQNDAYGRVVLKGTEIALKKRSLSPIAKSTYERNTSDVSAGLEVIKKSGAGAVVMVGTYSACAKFIADGKKSGYDPIYMNVSFVGADKMLEILQAEGVAEGEVVTQVVPPHTNDLPAVVEYKKSLAKHFPKSKPNFVSLEGYLSTKIFVMGLEKAGRNLTRESLIAAVETIHGVDIGAGNTISFSTSDHQGSEEVYPTVIHNGKYEIISDWSVLKSSSHVSE